MLSPVPVIVSVLRMVGFLPAALLICACSSAPPRPATLPRRDAHVVDIASLLPADVDVVVRIDLQRARSLDVVDDVLAWLRGAQLSESMIETIGPCLDRASAVTIAARLGPGGLDGDVLVRFRMPGDASSDVACGPRGWEHTGDAGGAAVYEPAHPERRRNAPAMMLADRQGEVIVVTPGQIDSVLRLVRDGPDVDPPVPPADGLVGLVARVDESRLPATWREKAPTLTAIASGLSTLTLRVDLGERSSARATLVYANAKAADAASANLKRVHDALVVSDKEALKRAALGAHAERTDDTIRVDLTIPSAP